MTAALKERLAAIYKHRAFPKFSRLSGKANTALYAFALASTAIILLDRAGVLHPEAQWDTAMATTASEIGMVRVGRDGGATHLPAVIDTAGITVQLHQLLTEGSGKPTPAGEIAAQSYVAELIYQAVANGDFIRHPEAAGRINKGLYFCCGGRPAVIAVNLEVQKRIIASMPLNPWHNEQAVRSLTELGADEAHLAELEAAIEAAEARHGGEGLSGKGDPEVST